MFVCVLCVCVCVCECVCVGWTDGRALQYDVRVAKNPKIADTMYIYTGMVQSLVHVFWLSTDIFI